MPLPAREVRISPYLNKPEPNLLSRQRYLLQRLGRIMDLPGLVDHKISHIVRLFNASEISSRDLVLICAAIAKSTSLSYLALKEPHMVIILRRIKEINPDKFNSARLMAGNQDNRWMRYWFEQANQPAPAPVTPDQQNAPRKRRPVSSYPLETNPAKNNRPLPLRQEDLLKLFEQLRSDITEEAQKRKITSVLVERNQGLVYRIAKRFLRHVRHDQRIELSDLVQEGNLGLLTAIGKFNPELGFKFSTYAVRLIEQAIMKAITEKAEAIKVPYSTFWKARKLKRLAETFKKDHGRAPTINELAEVSGFSPKEVKHLLSTQKIRIAPLDARIGGEATDTLMDEVPDPGSSPEDMAIAKLFYRNFFHALEPPERRVLELIFFREKDPVEAGEIVGLTRERVRQIQDQALNKLRELDAGSRDPSPVFEWETNSSVLKLILGALSQKERSLYEATYVNWVGSQKASGELGIGRGKIAEARRDLGEKIDKMFYLIQKIGLQNIKSPRHLLKLYK